MKNWKRCLSVVMTLAMLVGVLPTAAFAEGDFTISFNKDQQTTFTYDGNEKVLGVTADGVDSYQLTYQKKNSGDEGYSTVGSAIDAGDYRIYATSGELTSNYLTFTINQAEWPIKEADVSVAATHEYDNTSPTVTVSGGTEGQEYTVTYKKGGETLSSAPVNADKYSVVVSPTANYTGTAITKSFEITKKAWSVTGVTVAAHTYNGSAPTVTVSGGADSSEYELTYWKGETQLEQAPVNAGSYTVKVSPTANYTGTPVTADYTIEPKELTAPWVADIDPVTYDGTAHTPAPQVKESEGGKLLVKDTDYTLDYSNHTNAGTGTVTVRFSDNYQVQGSVEKTFTINPITISNPAVSVTNTGYGQQLTVAVTNNGVAVDPKDYTLTYAVGDSDTFTASVPVNVGSYKVKATLSDNYSGTPKSVVESFSITGTAIVDPSIVVSGNLEYTGSAVTPQITVYKNGTAVNSRDYTLTYYNSSNQEISAANLIKAGTYKVKATLNNNYSGESKTVEQTFNIAPKSISSAVVTFTETVFTENSYKNAKPTVKLGTKTLSLGVDYTLSYSDVDTANHKGYITISGCGNYTGTVVKEVTISNISAIATSISNFNTSAKSDNIEERKEILQLYKEFSSLSSDEQEAVKNAVGKTTFDAFKAKVDAMAYKVTNSKGGTTFSYRRGTSNSVVFYINADHTQFKGMYIGGMEVLQSSSTKTYYKVEAGSTKITLYSTWMKDFIKKSGTYTVDFVFDDGYGNDEIVSAKLKILSATDIPQTGDPFQMTLWVGLLGASVLALAGLGVYEVVKKKKKAQKRLEAAMDLGEEPSDEANTNE